MSRTPATHFGAKLEALQSDAVLGIVNPFPWISNAISREKSCLIWMLFLLTYIDVRTVKFSRLLNPDWSQFKFQARQPYARRSMLKSKIKIKGCATIRNLLSLWNGNWGAFWSKRLLREATWRSGTNLLLLRNDRKPDYWKKMFGMSRRKQKTKIGDNTAKTNFIVLFLFNLRHQQHM